MEQETQTSNEQSHLQEHSLNYPGPIYIKNWSLYAKRRGVHSETQD